MRAHTRLPEVARSGEIIEILLYKHFMPTKTLCKFNQSADSGHGDRERLNGLLIKAIWLQQQSIQRRNTTKDLIIGTPQGHRKAHRYMTVIKG